MRAKLARRAALCAIAALAALPATAPAQAAPATPNLAQAATPCSDGTTVETVDGAVCGIVGNGVTSYLGIPFAAPPVGDLRWEPPQPVTPWTGTFPATAPGNACPTVGGPTTEDCLNLDVQVPPSPGGAPLPVMVEIHGGGFVGGASRDGSYLATHGGVLYVSMNYRLGILGFLAHKAFGAHSGDYGLMDQQAALRWVRANIARFGGDPHNVTIFGQSAGGASVCDHVASPTAAGLFQRGISQSGFYNSLVGPNEVWEAADCKSEIPSQAQAEAAGTAFAAKVGCGGAADVAACLRSVPVPTLLAEAGQRLNPDNGGTVGPTVNGTTLPMSAAKAFATGHVNDVSLMIGADRDEINGGPLDPAVTATTPDQYTTILRRKYRRLASTVFALYPIERFPEPSAFLAFRTAVADADSVCPALTSFRRLSRHIPVYAWEGDNPDVPRPGVTLPTGSFHVAESPFMFPSPTVTLDPDQQAYQSQIVAQWAGFARTGSPTVPGAPRWPQYRDSAGDRLVMSLLPAGDSALTPASTIAMQHNCGFWNAVAPPPR